MSDLLLLGCFFIGVLNFALLIGLHSQLIDLGADLYYYSEQKSDGDEFE